MVLRWRLSSLPIMLYAATKRRMLLSKGLLRSLSAIFSSALKTHLNFRHIQGKSVGLWLLQHGFFTKGLLFQSARLLTEIKTRVVAENAEQPLRSAFRKDSHWNRDHCQRNHFLYCYLDLLMHNSSPELKRIALPLLHATALAGLKDELTLCLDFIIAANSCNTALSQLSFIRF